MQRTSSAPLTDDDVSDLLTSLKRNAIRQRAIAWAMLSPDGMRLSTFARGSDLTMLKTEATLLHQGFIIEHTAETRPGDNALRLRERWCEPYRSGARAVASIDDGIGAGLLALQWLSDPGHRHPAGQLLHALGHFPGGAELLPPLPRISPEFTAHMAQWVSDSTAYLTVAAGLGQASTDPTDKETLG